MRYGEYRSRNLPIGSGPVEAARKTVVGRRMRCMACAGRWLAPTRALGALRPAQRLVRRLLGTPPQTGRVRRWRSLAKDLSYPGRARRASLPPNGERRRCALVSSGMMAERSLGGVALS